MLNNYCFHLFREVIPFTNIFQSICDLAYFRSTRLYLAQVLLGVFKSRLGLHARLISASEPQWLLPTVAFVQRYQT